MIRSLPILAAASLLFSACSGGTDTATDDTSGTDGAADLVAGTYTGSITGPTISTNYTLTLAVVDATTVEASGESIQAFEIPLRVSGNDVKEAETWTDGAFTLTGDQLSLTYDPQSIAFTGSKN